MLAPLPGSRPVEFLDVAAVHLSAPEPAHVGSKGPGDRPARGTGGAGPDPRGRLLHGVRVLVVEDETIVALDLAQMLEDLGAEVCGTAASGAEALRKARTLRPTLAIVDVRLKDGETGVDVARTMADELGISIVFATAHTDQNLVARMAAVPGSMRLTKPYTIRDLADAARRVLPQ